MRKNRDFLIECAKVIVNIFETTGLDNKQKVVEISKIMSESAKTSNEYSPFMREVYDYVYMFLNRMTEKDFADCYQIAMNG